MVVYHGEYRVKPGMMDALIGEMKASGLEARFRAQKGNLFYTVSRSISDADVLILCDAWEDAEAFRGHEQSSDCDVWWALEKKYVDGCVPHKFEL